MCYYIARDFGVLPVSVLLIISNAIGMTFDRWQAVKYVYSAPIFNGLLGSCV